MMTENLPKPTTDLDRAKADIDEFGYCLLANALNSEQITALRNRIEEQAIAEKQQSLAFEDGGPTQQWGMFRDEDGRIRPKAFREENGGVNQRVWMLANKGKIFLDLLTHTKAKELVSYVLGEEYLLSSYTANIAKPGGVAMDLHTDQWWMPEPTLRHRRGLPVGSMSRTRFDDLDTEQRTMLAPPAASNVLWFLCDFTEANGATRVVPGSHMSGRHPDPQLDTQSIAAEGPAGTALITDGRVWHGTGANISNQQRYALITTYCGPQFRPQENFTVGLADEVLQQASPELLTLFGFKIWHAYGRIGDPTIEFIDRRQTPIRELRPE